MSHLNYISLALTAWSPALGVRLWELGEYQTLESQLPSLVDLDWIGNLLALTVVSVGEDRRKVWATVDLAKVCINADSLPC